MRLKGPLVRASLLRRAGRFSLIARADGREVEAYLPNPGRLEEILVPGRVLMLLPVSGRRRTAWDAVAALVGGTLVGIDSRVPNLLIREALLDGTIPEFQGYRLVKAEPKVYSSRLDFLLDPPCVLEVKGSSLVRDGVALFPDAPTVRGRRHLEELARARRSGMRAAIIFVVQREDARSLSPNWEVDPGFGEGLRAAVQGGVEAMAFVSGWSRDEILLRRGLEVSLA